MRLQTTIRGSFVFYSMCVWVHLCPLLTQRWRSRRRRGILVWEGSEVYIFARTNVPEKVKGQSSQVLLRPECIPVDGMPIHLKVDPGIFSGFPTISWYPFILLGGESKVSLAHEHNTMTRPDLEPRLLDPQFSVQNGGQSVIMSSAIWTWGVCGERHADHYTGLECMHHLLIIPEQHTLKRIHLSFLFHQAGELQDRWPH